MNVCMCDRCGAVTDYVKGTIFLEYHIHDGSKQLQAAQRLKKDLCPKCGVLFVTFLNQLKEIPDEKT